MLVLSWVCFTPTVFAIIFQSLGYPVLPSVESVFCALVLFLYGFRLTFQDVVAVGFPAIIVDAIIVCGTILLGVLVGRVLKMDRSIALLTACGSGICGAAAVLGVDGAIRPKPYKTAVAVATVVIFGTLINVPLSDSLSCRCL